MYQRRFLNKLKCRNPYRNGQLYSPHVIPNYPQNSCILCDIGSIIDQYIARPVFFLTHKTRRDYTAPMCIEFHISAFLRHNGNALFVADPLNCHDRFHRISLRSRVSPILSNPFPSFAASTDVAYKVSA